VWALVLFLVRTALAIVGWAIWQGMPDVLAAYVRRIR
jgi:hypothetical protein